jgi:hypothetical protein
MLPNDRISRSSNGVTDINCEWEGMGSFDIAGVRVRGPTQTSLTFSGFNQLMNIQIVLTEEQ